MRRSNWLPRTSWTLAAILWLAAGPLMIPLVGAMRCRHEHAMAPGHQMPMPPASSPTAPCYCEQMAGGSAGALLLTPAVPAVFPAAPVATITHLRLRFSRPPTPVSRISSPTPPPPNQQV
ncbi:MAG TPA: hypothetical protein VMH88_14370 [Gemmatimonadales bacterium]|nr:hypothetical protein [Gemmatimonadales bacterium]